MQRRQTTSLSVLLVLLLVLAGCADPDDGTDAPAQPRLEELEAELTAAQEQLAELERRNEALEAELEALRDAPPDDGPDGVADEAAAPMPWPSEAARLWTAEGLIDQLRVHLRDPEADLPEGWEPGMTEWVAFEVPPGVSGAYGTPGEVVAALAAEVDAPLVGEDQWETTIRALPDEDDPDLAYGAVLGWGFLDDSIVGRDIRITLTRTADGRWEPGGAEQRQHCRRGVTDDQAACL